MDENHILCGKQKEGSFSTEITKSIPECELSSLSSSSFSYYFSNVSYTVLLILSTVSLFVSEHLNSYRKIRM